MQYISTPRTGRARLDALLASGGAEVEGEGELELGGEGGVAEVEAGVSALEKERGLSVLEEKERWRRGVWVEWRRRRRSLRTRKTTYVFTERR